MTRYHAVRGLFVVLATMVAAGAVFAQSTRDGLSDTGYLSSLDDMALDMDLGSIATQTYDTIVVEAPQLSQAGSDGAGANIGDMDCATLEKWVAQHSDENGVLSGVEWAGNEYQAALTACAFPATQALALAAPGPAAGS